MGPVRALIDGLDAVRISRSRRLRKGGSLLELSFGFRLVPEGHIIIMLTAFWLGLFLTTQAIVQSKFSSESCSRLLVIEAGGLDHHRSGHFLS